jgi:hypothetical protein
MWRKKESWGAAFLIGVAFIIGLSIYNYFENARYFNPDVRSAVACWSQVSGHEPLISNSSLTVYRYIDEPERERFYPISSKPDQVVEISNYFGPEEYSLVHVLISRVPDWDRKLEKEVRKRWKIVAENQFAGVVLLSIAAIKRPYLRSTSVKSASVLAIPR